MSKHTGGGEVDRKHRQFTRLSLTRLNYSQAIMTVTHCVQILPTCSEEEKKRSTKPTRGATKKQTNTQTAETGKVGKLQGGRFWRMLQLSSLQPPAGAVNGQDYSPLIHLASGSWALNSGLNRSSTVSLVSLPGWLSAVKNNK